MLRLEQTSSMSPASPGRHKIWASRSSTPATPSPWGIRALEMQLSSDVSQLFFSTGNGCEENHARLPKPPT